MFLVSGDMFVGLRTSAQPTRSNQQKSTRIQFSTVAAFFLACTCLHLPITAKAGWPYIFPADQGWNDGNSTTVINFAFTGQTPEELCLSNYQRITAYGGLLGTAYIGYEARDEKNGRCLVDTGSIPHIFTFANLFYRSRCPYDSFSIISDQYNSSGTVTHGTTEPDPDWPGRTLWLAFYDDPGLQCSVNFARSPVISNQKQPQQCSSSGSPVPTAGNPIIVANGNKYQAELDYQSESPFSLNFTRYYNSTAPEVSTGIGTKWRHNYTRQISASGTGALAHRSNGQAFAYNYNGTNWQGDPDISDTLAETFDGGNIRSGWLYTTSNDSVEQYNITGQLTLVTNRQGQTQSFTYDLPVANGGDDNNSTLDKVTGFAGDTLYLGYDADSFHPERIISMIDPNGHTYQYDYDTIGNLQAVTYPDDTPADDADNPTRIYHYENATFTHQLTGITDETGSRVTWVYDNEGRAISSELAGGVDKSTLAYNTDGSVTVTNPLNKQTTYQFTTLHGVKKLTSVTGHPTANCAGDYKTYTYDANGYLASKTDWNGHLTTYQHDSSGRELSRTEVVGTPEERTITTEWHADYRVPIKITEAGKIIEFVYDTQGRVLSQTVRSAP